MKSFKIWFNLEEDFRVEELDSDGFSKNSMDIKAEELPELIRELCECSTESEEETEQLLTMLRQGYELFKLKSMTFKIKGE